MAQRADYDITWIDRQAPRMLERVIDWASINTDSANLEGLATLGEKVEAAFKTLGARSRWVDLPPGEGIDDAGQPYEQPYGRALHASMHPEAARKVFLCIHTDTVFAADHPFQCVEKRDAETLHGPGVADAKGGLVVMLAALEALERSPLAGRIGWEVVINPDEEVGSHGSDALIRETAGRCDLALLYEPALPDGSLVGPRKGSGNFTLVVRGRSAHAGRDFAHGRNAVAALAGMIGQLDALNGRSGGRFDGLTVNVGRVIGGGPVNVVPDLALVRYNVRYTDDSQLALVQQRVAQLLEEVNRLDGFCAEYYGKTTAPPKRVGPGTSQLQAIVEACAAEIDLPPIQWASTGGVCDGNRTAAMGLATIDTLGVCGGAIHSDQEFLRIDSLAQRAKLSALLLMKLAAGVVEWPPPDLPPDLPPDSPTQSGV